MEASRGDALCSYRNFIGRLGPRGAAHRDRQEPWQRQRKQRTPGGEASSRGRTHRAFQLSVQAHFLLAAERGGSVTYRQRAPLWAKRPEMLRRALGNKTDFTGLNGAEFKDKSEWTRCPVPRVCPRPQTTCPVQIRRPCDVTWPAPGHRAGGEPEIQPKVSSERASLATPNDDVLGRTASSCQGETWGPDQESGARRPRGPAQVTSNRLPLRPVSLTPRDVRPPSTQRDDLGKPGERRHGPGRAASVSSRTRRLAHLSSTGE